MPSTCCVPQCTVRGGHAFPKNENLRDAWVQAIKRLMEVHKDGKRKLVKWMPTKTSVVCKHHFVKTDYRDQNWTSSGDNFIHL